jgi:hypothetical protein
LAALRRYGSISFGGSVALELRFRSELGWNREPDCELPSLEAPLEPVLSSVLNVLGGV